MLRPLRAPPSAARRHRRWGCVRGPASLQRPLAACSTATPASPGCERRLPLAPVPLQGKLPQLRDDLKAGWLEKRSGDGSSLNALPVDSWKWQRRWFVLAMESGFLYYFKSPEQMSTPGVSPKVVAIWPCRRVAVQSHLPACVWCELPTRVHCCRPGGGCCESLIRTLSVLPSRTLSHHARREVALCTVSHMLPCCACPPRIPADHHQPARVRG